MTTRWAVLVVAGLAACDPDPPSSSRGASGPLDDDVACFIYPSDGYASIYLGDHHWLEVYLPPFGPDLWGRGTAYYGFEDDLTCRYGLPGVAVRVQYGSTLVGDPECDACSTRYRALFVEGLEFPAAEACTGGIGCDASQCRPVAAASAEALYMWCDSPEDFAL